jgi:hypothetical protein
MKAVLLFFLGCAISFITVAQNKNLPTPSSDLQTLQTGSYVIAMDNTLQLNTAVDFNLKTYGLVVYLLNNNVKIKWSIKSGKSKDGIDITGTAEQFQPTLVSGGVTRNFKAGPFVIYAVDTTGVAALITAFYTANSLTGNNRPKVYRLTAAVSNVDIRYDMAGFKPKAQILNDGSNSSIHVGYMTNCGISSSNYSTGPATDLYNKCYTFASEPHNSAPTSSVINAIRYFVTCGGNFLAQCAAVEAYENNASGHFHSTNGITVVNTAVSDAATIYPDADLAFSQYDGIFNVKQNGSVANWTLASGSSFTNNEHNHATGGTLGSQSPIGASVSKLTSGALPGGLVFYLGNHNFSSITDIESINGIRMYMNAFLTPVSINSNCTIGANLPNPLPVKLVSFTATLNNNKVDLNWITATEINVSHFVVESSNDGIHFKEAGVVFAKGNSTEIKNYSIVDNSVSNEATLVYYRLRTTNMDGKNEYSSIQIVRIYRQPVNSIHILSYPNPVTDELHVTIPAAWQNKKVSYELFNTGGQVSKKIEIVKGSQIETLNVRNLNPGLYIVRVSCEGQSAQQKIIKQ